MEIKTANLLVQPCESPVGTLRLAGTIRHSAGVPFSNMRILGSYAMVLILAGSGRYSDQRGRDRKVGAGDLLMIYPDIAHAYGPGDREFWDEIFLVFDGPVFDLFRKQSILDEDAPVQRLAPINYWFRRIETIASSANADTRLVTICKLQLLLAELREHQQSSGISAADRAWLGQATKLVEQNPFAQDFSLESVARSLGVSYVAFRKKFVRLSGVSPGQFRSRAVMQRAGDLLRESGSSNRQVAQRLGFCDEFHFSRRFKQITGLSPREFLRLMPREPAKVYNSDPTIRSGQL